MSKKVTKFEPDDVVKFLEIYRTHECLWDLQNKNYKNRDARDAALKTFSEEFGVEDFGPKEITAKIKNLRTQYIIEKKKVKDSMGTGSSSTDIYKPKLVWYSLMDSFIRKTSEARATTSNLNDDSIQRQDFFFPYESLDNVDNIDDCIIEVPTSVLPKFKKPKRKLDSDCSIQEAINKLDEIEKRAKLEEDELVNFGKYVTSTLRKLNPKNCIHAQDEIQSVLSKYKMQNIEKKERWNCTPMPQTSSSLSQNGEELWDENI